MAYRPDPDLAFLENCSSEELDNLVYILTYDPKDNKQRYTEHLSDSPLYQRYYPDHQKYWQDIAGELQCFGGNTFSNLARSITSSYNENGSGSAILHTMSPFARVLVRTAAKISNVTNPSTYVGVPYKEILCEVCKQLKVNFNENSDVKLIEQNLLMKILEDSLGQLNEEDRKELAEELGLDNTNNIKTQALLGVFQAIFKKGGFKSYILINRLVNLILKKLIGRGLPAAGNRLLMKFLKVLSGPIGWTLNVAWTAYDISGPAYRVTIPAVIQVAYLRSLNENREAIKQAEQVNVENINL
ncbi:hypothetical protein B0187_06865 [Haemophilus paracuniculus]|uniref:Uncharacterized protein n=1 Tax=Haemophilus paracuniculus TaxID=734 RepID=A0A1T0ARR8_9PAST|nr:DUF3944 domain-containing protein [Haemophilus paracuniculus]OOR98974.1 hypothetical protein B0187_06865 [Haemophilus paracuniculus]